MSNQKLFDIASEVNRQISAKAPPSGPDVLAELVFTDHAASLSIGEILIWDSENGFGDWPKADSINAGQPDAEIVIDAWQWHIRRRMALAGMVEPPLVVHSRRHGQ